MELWEKRNAWIAHFDILGFKNFLENDGGSLPIAVLQSQIDDLIKNLKQSVATSDESIDYFVFSDTFILFSKSDQVNGYPSLLSASKSLIRKSISMGLPIRGAISYGDCVFGHQNKILMGKAFLESHDYGEDQNWLGLILTPSATQNLLSHELYPLRHGFINKDIPLRKLSDNLEFVYAYTFINGSTNFECTLLSKLEELKCFAPDSVKIKYTNTINFIKKHYVVRKSS